MRKFKTYILSFVLSVLAVLPAAAQDSLSVVSDTSDVEAPALDSLRISIITCTPGKDIYAKFGHTALRVVDYTQSKDAVFNYGCFNYNSENFLFKFLLGQTDYLLEAEEFEYFMYRYSMMGNGVSEQVLNLTQQEANKLLTLLLENLRPENQKYRYNWLYDNCTERARDMIEKAVDGEIVYTKEEKQITVRQMLRDCLKECKWAEFGVDMILGLEIDKNADKRIQMFIPAYYSSEADDAIIVRADGTKVPLVAETCNILQETFVDEETNYFVSPLFIFTLLAIVSGVLLSAFGIGAKKKREFIWFDAILHLLQGLAGIIVAFLFFFSEHPAVSSNWLIIVFNPIALLYSCWLTYCMIKNKKNIFAYANLAVMFGFIVAMMAVPQSFNPAMYLLVLALLLRAASQVYFLRLKK